jgi:hypothetical protein
MARRDTAEGSLPLGVVVAMTSHARGSTKQKINLIVVHDLVKELIDSGEIQARKGGRENGQDVIFLKLLIGGGEFQARVKKALQENRKDQSSEITDNTLRENLKRARVLPQ